ncbi:MAG: hypothetical protein U0175_06265 [Caldilineaceae bacterium]
MFKQPPISDWLASRDKGYLYRELSRVRLHTPSLQRREAELGVHLNELEAEYRNSTHHCPQCGQPMIDMGLDFKPPKQVDEKAWQILAGMYRVGHVFHTCGCDGPGFIPTTRPAYEDYLQSRRRHFVGQLDQVQRAKELDASSKQEAGNYWLERIAKIDTELSNIIKQKSTNPSLD